MNYCFSQCLYHETIIVEPFIIVIVDPIIVEAFFSYLSDFESLNRFYWFELSLCMTDFQI